MSQLLKKFIGNNQVGADNIRLENDSALKARDFGNTTDIEIIKVDANDKVMLVNNTVPSANNSIDLGENSLRFQRVHSNALSGDTLSIEAVSNLYLSSNSDNAEFYGDNAGFAIRLFNANGDFYSAIKAPDGILASTTWTLPSADGSAGEVLTTDGAGNLSWAPDSATPTFAKQTFTLSAGDITNQYVELSSEALANSIQVLVKGAGVVLEGASHDYSVDYTGGTGGVTRISFLNDLAAAGAAELVAGDVLQIQFVEA